MAGFFANLPSLALLLIDHNPDFVALQETHIPEDNTEMSRGNYNIALSNCHTSRKSGVAIMVKKGIPFSATRPNTTNPSIVISANTPYGNINIANIYVECDSVNTARDLETLKRVTQDPLLLLGDFNAHNPLWGSSALSRRGAEVGEWLESTDLVLLNDGSPTLLSTRNTFTAIDISLASPSLAPALVWNVTNPFGSDHLPITIIVDKARKPCFFRSRFIETKADWELFQTNLEKFLIANPKSNLINKEIALLTRALRHAANSSMPSTKPSTRTSPPWLTAEAKELIRKKHTAWRKFKRCRSLENAIEYRKVNALMRRKIKSDKKDAWINFTNNIHPSNSVEENWQRVRKAIGINPKNNRFSLQTETGVISDPCEIAEVIAKHLAKDLATDIHPSCVMKMEMFERDKRNLFKPTCNPILEFPLTLEELEKGLQSCKSKSPGLDKITLAMLKNSPRSLKIRLLELYRGR